jgi:hypothetical protein
MEEHSEGGRRHDMGIPDRPPIAVNFIYLFIFHPITPGLDFGAASNFSLFFSPSSLWLNWLVALLCPVPCFCFSCVVPPCYAYYVVSAVKRSLILGKQSQQDSFFFSFQGREGV